MAHWLSVKWVNSSFSIATYGAHTNDFCVLHIILYYFKWVVADKVSMIICQAKDQKHCTLKQKLRFWSDFDKIILQQLLTISFCPSTTSFYFSNSCIFWWWIKWELRRRKSSYFCFQIIDYVCNFDVNNIFCGIFCKQHPGVADMNLIGMLLSLK